MSLTNTCILCNNNELYLFDYFPSFKLVSSDCKPTNMKCKLCICENCGLVQKILDNGWITGVEDIYSQYDSFWQSKGATQLIIDKNSSTPVCRSSKIIDFILEYINNLSSSSTKRLLDFGSSKGEFLEIFSLIKNNWELYAADLPHDCPDNIKKIPSFKQYFSVERDFFTSNTQFDLTVLIHTLEHLTNPSETIRKLKSKLTQKGYLFIQVPNIIANPFDLIIADHASHFTLDILTTLLNTNGFSVAKNSSNYIVKELSIIGCNSKNETLQNNNLILTNKERTQITKNIILEHIFFLKSIITDMERICAANKIGIFGTSISATWIVSYFKDKIDFFIDEDPSRIGGSFYEKEIIPPNKVPEDSIVYIPLIPTIANKIQEKLKFKNCYMPCMTANMTEEFF